MQVTVDDAVGPAADPPSEPAAEALVDSILKDIKCLMLLEASELVSKIEETFGMGASSAPVAMAVAGRARQAAASEPNRAVGPSSRPPPPPPLPPDLVGLLLPRCDT